jgi:transcription elongation factor Elf1
MGNKNSELTKQESLETELEVCQACLHVYQVTIIKSGEEFNDFGFWFCPFCGQMVDCLISSEREKIERIKDNEK